MVRDGDGKFLGASSLVLVLEGLTKIETVQAKLRVVRASARDFNLQKFRLASVISIHGDGMGPYGLIVREG